MRKIVRYISVAIAGALFVTGCEPPPTVIPPKLSFTRYQPIYLDVADISIIDAYKSPMRAPYVEHLLPYSPADAMHIWVKDRLRTVGKDKLMEVIIKDGSVMVTTLPKEPGLKGMMSPDPDKRYDARIAVEMRIYGGDAMSEASVYVTAVRSINVAANTSPSDRDAIFRRLIFDLMEEANAELEKNMFLYFANYISYSHSP